MLNYQTIAEEQKATIEHYIETDVINPQDTLDLELLIKTGWLERLGELLPIRVLSWWR